MGERVLTITALRDAEYLISSVALGIDEYYAGHGEGPGIWSGGWAEGLGLVGVVEADGLRALVEGRHPGTGVELLAGQRARSVHAFDVTLSAPKSVSLLWALGTEGTADVVSAAHREAAAEALAVLESKAAVARRQVDGVRTRVPTDGFAIAAFTHRTSRAGDPQLHTHCLIPNLVRREDGRHVAFDAALLYEWGRAAGSVYQNHLQPLLVERLGVRWGPDRHNTRELEGFSREQLRAFSKRTVAIEAELEAQGARYESPVLAMRADDQASLRTRPAKDHSLSPTVLRDRWDGEAARVGLRIGRDLDGALTSRGGLWVPPSWEQTVTALADPETGLCARSARFGHSDVVEQLCALSAGRFITDEVLGLADRFLASEHVVRLVPEGNGRRPAQWSTTAHRALEDDVRSLLEQLAARAARAVPAPAVAESLIGVSGLGVDQVGAVRALTGTGVGLRAVLAPAGFGKTLMVHAAAQAAARDHRPVVAVATTAKAVGELEAAGLPAKTIARLRLDLQQAPLPTGSVVVLDEVSQTATRDARTVLAAVAACPGAQLWVLGDPRQSQPVGPSGFADEITRLVTAGAIPSAELTVNRRQHHPADRDALALLRTGRPADSQAVRDAHGWEHNHASPHETRRALALAAAADIAAHPPGQVVALTVSHGEAEDLADRIRAHLTATGRLAGPALTGPGWTTDRAYQAGDRILLHTRCGPPSERLVNGTTGTVTAATSDGLTVAVDHGGEAQLPGAFVRGCRANGAPNVSHAWARTVDGAQGGTWAVCHLLGTPALDAYRGYTGQSRSQQPTHTWNTIPITEIDHGGVVVDHGTPAEQVAIALAREPDPSMAARSDPFVADRQMRAAIAEHRQILAAGPPDLGDELVRAEAAAARARDRQRAADSVAGVVAAQLDANPLRRRLGAEGRRHFRTLLGHQEHAQLAVETAVQRVADAEHHLADLQHRHQAYEAYQHRERWRKVRVDELTQQLAHHWVEVVDTCVRAGDPLAYGIDTLRWARATVCHDVDMLEASLPADRAGELAEALEARRQADGLLRTATTELHVADEALAEASRRRWGRRDPHVLASADRHQKQAQHQYQQAVGGQARAHDRVAALGEHEEQRRRAFMPVRDRYADLEEHLDRLDRALDATRTRRVLALLARPSPELLGQLGEPGGDPAGQAVWCHHAYQLEARLDRGQQEQPLLPFCREYEAHQDIALARNLVVNPAVVGSGPEAWGEVVRAARTTAASPAVDWSLRPERSLGLDLEL